MRKRVLFLAMTLILAISVIFAGCSSNSTGTGNDAQATQGASGDNGSGSNTTSNDDVPVDNNGSDNTGNSDNNTTPTPDADPVNNETTPTPDTGNTGSDDDSDSKSDYSELVPSYATGEYKKKDLKSSFNPDKATKIEFSGDSVNVNGDGATADGSKVTITAKGTYLVSGTSDDGQIVISAGDDDDVRLILNGVDLTCKKSSAIYAINADKVILTLVDGTVNTFSDTADAEYLNAEKEEPNAAVFTDCDLSINGNGTLNVNGKFHHAIRVKADIKITSGTINVSAVEKGFKAKKTFNVLDGTISIKAGDDGINAGSVINIDGGTITVVSEDDAVQSDEQVIINAGLVDTTGSKKSFKAPIFTPNGGEIR